ncbi:uncharacterized protein M421DRAFT_197634 [Didymella exigua CBS 183.55]|uniref:RBR-type E3 ubiquitin transferase n=1 Tax=Didymella exigua CBS 183.55 TaxID=1150837 RepID=A0A6A5S200_9PLEO|nr:uncharacterized protein M421DRAFT_197634 [Didymella exigua CBS 183.55]KAF1933454.1 hypothetical protein M421DRAFT_197634 [Didymella exigua CBS 183.55]
MAPSTRLGVGTRLSARPGRRMDPRQVMTTVRPGSARDPIVLEDTSLLEASAAHPTKPREKATTGPARDARGRFIKSEVSSKSKAGRKKVAKTILPPKPEKQARPSKTECIICATEKPAKRSFTASDMEADCQHFEQVCNICIQRQIKTKVSARELTEAHLPCMFPQCEAVLDHTALKKILPKALFETWDTAVTKFTLAADAAYIACLNPACGIYFSAEDCGSKHKFSSKSKSKSKQKETDIDKAACPYCEHEICLSCNRPWHSGSCNSVKRREDQQSERTIKRLGAKPCPKCGVNIQKNGGCDHMKCKRCRHNFCWECLGLYNGSPDIHAKTCSHHRPMIAHDLGNFVADNLTVAQINALIERARQDREAGRAPQPNLRLAPGVQLVNGAAVRPNPAVNAARQPGVFGAFIRDARADVADGAGE